MKILIGIILALCMLSTMAFAATPTISDENVDQKAMTVSFKYAGIAEGAQATMLAYEVTDAMITEATPIPAYVNEATTPIKGIDQEGVDADGFSFKVAEGYTGKIVVKIGGTDMEPAAFLVEFKAATQTVTVLWGDVNGDGSIDVGDASDIIKAITGGQKTYGNYTIGVKFAGNMLWGDVNADGSIDVGDASDVIKAITGGQKTYSDYTIGVNATLVK